MARAARQQARTAPPAAAADAAAVDSAAVDSTAGISVHAMADMAWVQAGKPGLYLKPVRAEAEQGRYLGLVRIDEGARTGLHQHLDVACSYVLKGSLTDYAGTLVRGQAGINVNGDTHDAIAYEDCLLVSRMDGPTIYAADDDTDHQLHSGARKARFNTIDRSRQPDINLTVEQLRAVPGCLPGMLLRMVFDYAGTAHDRRMVCLQFQPGSVIPPHRTGGIVDWYVIAGDITVNGRRVLANSFVVQQPGAEVSATCGHGCMLLAWAEAPVTWLDLPDRPDPYGFPPR
jgi:anti-sigma factor ChrR (cupin superfamily)